MKKEVTIYEYWGEKAIEHADISRNIISFKKMRWILNRYAIPNFLHYKIIHEMFDNKNMMRINHFMIKLPRKKKFKYNFNYVSRRQKRKHEECFN